MSPIGDSTLYRNEYIDGEIKPQGAPGATQVEPILSPDCSTEVQHG
jgi:hypothetical protein